MTTETLFNTPYELAVPAASDKRFAVHNPANGTFLADVPNAGATETSAAIDRAYAALPAWAATPAIERANLLRRVAALMIERREHLATVMTMEQGKPLSEARGEIAYAASFFTWFAGEAERIYGQLIPASAANKRLMVIQQPVGVCAMITPWNFPTAMLTRKLGAALAAGCTAVCKPAEQTPLSALELEKLFVEAGAPDGIVTVLSASDPRPFADTIFADERVRKISFTGSTEIGKLLIRRSADSVKRISVELGGNAPFIIFDDSNLDAAVTGAMASKFRNAGQTCVCANRIFVQRGIYDRFAEAFSARVAQLRVGDGMQDGTEIGPLIDGPAGEKVAQHVADATGNGARVLVGGSTLADNNRFWVPTVLADARADMLVAREETFGPVAPLISFDNEAEVIGMANNSSYGLAAYVFTQNVSRAWRMAEGLEYGIIGMNDGMPSTAQAPFGGVKQSGIGREGGPQGIAEYLNVKYVSWGIE